MPLGLSDPLPPLRQALEAVPVEQDGKPLFLLRDLEDLTREGLALSPGGMALAAMLDGRRSASELVGLYAKSTGHFLKAEEVLDLVNRLEQALLLETPEVARRRQVLLREFLESPVRKAVFQGLAYPREPLELSGVLGRFFQDPKGPGKEAASKPLAPPPLGLVSPHIDLNRGGPAYAWAYQALSESSPPDAVVALGVSHMSPNSPWAMTRKSYETPYGALSVHEGLYQEIRACLWYDPADDEWAHRTEHSLEFQALWLRYLWRERTPPWVPILCSSFERFCPDKPPSGVPTVEEAILGIAERLKKRVAAGERLLILAGVDLSHYGPRFGDEEEITPEVEKRVEAEDRRSLEHALRLEAEEFYLSVVSGG